ncbi:YIP1 family protein [Methanothermococcus sp.]|uniref:YIP1 family protein n=1 Tax=Methanothermococcus sp. TaxID=2614238 RepID=UPI0025EB5719|nr:YIP1 family protein [Methanothermococcus sp.]
MNIKELILNPDNFFKNLSYREVSLKTPFLIVLIFSVFMSIYTYYTTSIMFKIFPADMQSMMTISMIIAAVSALVGGFIAWLLVAGVMHLISMAFSGVGSFKRTFEFTGYGFIANLIGLCITIPIGYYFLSNAHIPTLTMANLQNPIIVKQIMSSIFPKTMVYTNLLVGIAVSLWNLGLWTYGIKYARNLELKKAFIVALIPTVLFGAYQLYSVAKFL